MVRGYLTKFGYFCPDILIFNIPSRLIIMYIYLRIETKANGQEISFIYIFGHFIDYSAGIMMICLTVKQMNRNELTMKQKSMK